MIKEAICRLVERENLSRDEAKGVMKQIMEGKATSAQTAAFLVALRMKKETVDEIAGLAEEMINQATGFPWNGENLVDTCGTGGDRLGSFNVSTTCAFVVAAAGAKVAKHGNRALSSRCGSADVLEELGVRLDIPCELVRKSLEEVGIGFLYAPFFHRAMKHALPVRQQMGIRTVFNLLGPLTNPLRASIRLMGVYDSSLTCLLAKVMSTLGAKRAFVVRGEDGLDEVSVTGKTAVAELREGRISTYFVDPEQLGLRRWSLDEIKGGDRELNARITYQVLTGKQRGAKRDITLINSAFCIVGAGVAPDLKRGIRVARECIDSGRALQKLNQLVEFTNSFGGS